MSGLTEKYREYLAAKERHQAAKDVTKAAYSEENSAYNKLVNSLTTSQSKKIIPHDGGFLVLWKDQYGKLYIETAEFSE